MSDPDFTRAAYRTLLETLLARGYRAVDYARCRSGARNLILRHDIDFSPRYATPLAEIESDLGLAATYFFQVRAPFYRADDAESRAVIERLQALGHAIGLHFDAKPHEGDPDGLENAARSECEHLESLAGAPIRVVSFHRPAAGLLGRTAPVGGRIHAYEPRFFEAIGYCSDSRGRWRHGHPLAHPAIAEGRALQLLTHPIWWAEDDGGDREAALARLQARLGPWSADAIAEVVTGYDPETGAIRD